MHIDQYKKKNMSRNIYSFLDWIYGGVDPKFEGNGGPECAGFSQNKTTNWRELFHYSIIRHRDCSSTTEDQNFERTGQNCKREREDKGR
uniref:Uncharacterized protein n=1 Tax=Anguilla anguilla TaxID=7936 RepID=A0A0E9RFV4_ANGAN